MVVIIVVLFVLVVLYGVGVAGIKVGFCAAAAAGVAASASVVFQRNFVSVGVVPIAWNAASSLYEFFVVVLVLDLVVAAAAGATASTSFLILGVIFGIVAVPIAWNATIALYEFFFLFLVLGLGSVLILFPAGRRLATAVFDNCFSLIVAVLVLSLVLDGAVGVEATAVCIYSRGELFWLIYVS